MADLSRRAILRTSAVLAAVAASPAAAAACAKDRSVPRSSRGRLRKVADPEGSVGRSLDHNVAALGGCNARDLRIVEKSVLERGTTGVQQSTGWYEAWTAAASPYAVRARQTSDIVAAVNFARDNNVKLVVKGTGHDYLGRNCAPDSLLVWTHDMRDITVHDAFVPRGPRRNSTGAGDDCRGRDALAGGLSGRHPGRPVRRGRRLYERGRLRGFTFGSGFGPFSKRYGTGSGGIVQAEIVTADGQVRTVNQFSNRICSSGFAAEGGLSASSVV